MSKYRVLLAPLRFGAGIKGKILDAWVSGMPVVTTSVGAEGLMMTTRGKEEEEEESEGEMKTTGTSDSGSGRVRKIGRPRPVSATGQPEGTNNVPPGSAVLFGGAICDDVDAFVDHAVQLYTDARAWETARVVGKQTLQQGFAFEKVRSSLERIVHEGIEMGMGKGARKENKEVKKQDEDGHGESESVGLDGFGCVPGPSRLQQRRDNDWLGALVWSNNMRAFEYMSRYIEESRKTKKDTA